MSKKTIKANSKNTTNGNIEFEQPKNDVLEDVLEISRQQIKEEPKYPTELVVKSKSIAEFCLHPDVIRAILTKSEYTLSDAKLAIRKYIDSFNR